ncbi:MAG TPA: hypothetical protein VGG42_13135 [Acidobacteriaceae bacterium]|jgi:hypothetical protein
MKTQIHAALLLLSLGVSGVSAVAQNTAAEPERPCSVRAATFEGWQAEEMANSWVQLIFVPQLGGRLMQVTFDGHAYLFDNPVYAGKYIPPDAAKGRWINYGGDKIWPLPEGNDDEQDWTGASTPLDDGAYAFSVVSQGQRCTVRLDGPPDPAIGLQYSREISIGTDSPEIDFHAVTKNYTGHTVNWSVQSVSQYNLADAAQPDGYNHQFWAYTPVNPNSAYLLGYHVRDGLANDPSYSLQEGLFRVHWKYIESEVWVDSTAGWLAVVDGASHYAMVEKTRHDSHSEYPSKASIIFYKNGPTAQLDDRGMPHFTPPGTKETPYYMEAEVNSPMVELDPGQEYSFDTHWFPFRMEPALRSVVDAGVVGDPLQAVRRGDQIQLTGRFGVFFPGHLEARLYSKGGAEQRSVKLRAVSPRDLIELRSSVPGAGIVRVSVHLIDSQNVDRGSLGEVFVNGENGAE